MNGRWRTSFQVNLEQTLSWREERKKRELQRKFEEPYAPEGLPALPFSSVRGELCLKDFGISLC